MAGGNQEDCGEAESKRQIQIGRRTKPYVPLSALHRFIEVYRVAGGVVEIELFPDMPHGFACKPGAQSDRALEIMKAFIFQQLTYGSYEH